MKVYLGSDHRGFKLAEELYLWLIENNVAVVNAGAASLDPVDDYVDYAQEVGKRVSQVMNNGHEDTRGIVLCGSGFGVDFAVNKVKGIRCGIGFNADQIKHGRNLDDINVLALAADYTTIEDAKQFVKIFLETPFIGEEKHKRRIEKIAKIEQGS